MQEYYDYALSETNQTINLCIIKIGDLVWWGSVFNIGKTEFIGIIINADHNFGYNESSYQIYTKNGVISTDCIFPLET